MNKLTFSNLYNATKEAIHSIKEPLVLSKNKRAVESAIDSAQDSKIDAEAELENELSVITEGKVIDVNKILSLRQTIIDAENTVVELTKFKEEFFSKEV